MVQGDAEKALQVVPISGLPPPAGSTKPRDLWKWVQTYENKTGGQVFALAHNGNLSNGWMFLLDKTLATGRIEKNYIKQQARNEHSNINQFKETIS